MMHQACDRQPDILAAATYGRELPAAFQAHLASCPSCREQVEAVAFVRGLADTADATHPLPDPAVIWWKAQLLRRWQAERKAAAPIERMRWIELAAGLASLAVVLVWQWRGLLGFVSRAFEEVAAAASAAPQGVSPTVVALMVGGTASAAALILAAFHRRLGGA